MPQIRHATRDDIPALCTLLSQLAGQPVSAATAEELSRQRGCLGTWLVSGFARENDAHRFYCELGDESIGYRFVKKPL